MISGNEIWELFELRRFGYLRQLFKSTEIADIAESFAALDPSKCILLIRLVPKNKRSSLFSYLPYELQEELIEQLPQAVVTFIMNEMDADDRTQLLEELPNHIRSQIIRNLSPMERRLAWKLLSYPEESVGRLMDPEVWALRQGMKVREAIDYIQKHLTVKS